MQFSDGRVKLHRDWNFAIFNKEFLKGGGNDLITLKNIDMIYENDTTVLKNLNLTVEKNDWITVLGASGSGKSTLLNMISGFLQPSTGSIEVDGIDLSKMTVDEMQAYRRNEVAVVYQDFKLFDQFSVLENVLLPQLPYAKREVIEKKAKELLERVGLGHRLTHFPTELSGGEKQRVAIARAFLSDPSVLLCDEPTGNLDGQTSEKIMKLIQDLHETGVTLLLVTHDQELVKYGNRVVTIEGGAVEERGHL